MREKKRCGLIGEYLKHSFSPAIHAMLADYEYQLFELQAHEVKDFLRKGNFDGLNVTIPYKQTVIPFCAELTPAAKAIGSVNTIVRRADGSLLGDNTDYDGFAGMVRAAGADLKNKKVLILGSGGASLTVKTVLQDLGASEIVTISRSGADNYDNLERHANAQFLVNTTPLGMYPNNGVSPLNLERLPHLEAVFDLIYNPSKTQLLLDAQRQGLEGVNGLGMLVAQAKVAAERFLGTSIDERMITSIINAIEKETKNLLLIGMPGAGKSTVARQLAQRLGRPLVDIDDLIELRANCSIPEIFATQGESAFREMEHQILCEVSKESGQVIAAGGGIVTHAANHDLIRQHSHVIWLQRAIEELSKEGRPLSQTHSLETLYETRAPLYAMLADQCVELQSAEQAVNAILKGTQK